MRLSRWVRIGGSGPQLDEVHERVVILGVDPGTPSETLNTAARMGGSGSRVSAQHWDSLDVTVTFGIDVPKRELETRREIFNNVKKWALSAKGSHLYTNQMPDKRVYIDKVVFPNGGDMFNWTKSYDIVFRAFSIPFWQDETPGQVMQGLITSGSVNIDVGGDEQTVIDADFKNKSGMTINRFVISAGGNTLTLTNLELGGSETLSINHGADGLLRITAGERSVLDRRTGSADLYVLPGANTVSIEADRAGELTVRAFGRYL